MILKLVILLVVSVLGGTNSLATEARFDNYHLYDVKVENPIQLTVLLEIEKNLDGYRFWDEPRKLNSVLKIVVPPHKFAEFSELVDQYRFDVSLVTANLQEFVDKTKIKSRDGNFGWTSYHTLTEINNWLASLATEYPKIVTVIDLEQKTTEGRIIRGVKVSYKEGNPGVFLETNIHAREWITGAVSTYILNQFLTSQNAEIRALAENFDWYIFPQVNPDGYVYSHTSNRMWRKTRSKTNILCYGVDPNRNWDHAWMVAGASSSPCSDSFAGPKPFSESETQALSNFYRTLKNIPIYISFHSYSQLLMIPFGNTTDRLSNYDDAVQIAKNAAAKLKERYGTSYKVGNIAETIYKASGGSIDWIKDATDTVFSYVYELRDTGRYGFNLPPDQIIPTAEETLDSLIVLVNESYEKVKAAANDN
uniref:Putative zinc carboxypeptidase a 1 n=1 Tax=Corethrella appendiculata TaxID=1370023 RepID=U5EWN0_9DIPT